MAIYVSLKNHMGDELDRRPVAHETDDDSAELSQAIHDAIDNWIFAVGDKIEIWQTT